MDESIKRGIGKLRVKFVKNREFREERYNMLSVDVSDRILVGNRWYKIRLVPDLYKREGKSVYGYTNYLAGEIVIDALLQHDHRVEVLIHEIFHIIEDIYSIEEGSETTKQCMSVCWTQLLGNLGIDFQFSTEWT